MLGGARESQNFRRFSSIDADDSSTLDILKRSMPYVPKHHANESIGKNDSHSGNILSSSYLKEQAVKNGVDLAEIERYNRGRFGVKKPANKWAHEMDDCRITAD